MKILSSLKPCIDVLDANDRLIRELRNNVKAHDEISSKGFRGTTEIFQHENEPYKNIFLSAKCGCMFIDGLTDNLVSEVVFAKEILKEHMSSPSSHGSDYFASIKEAKDIQTKIISNLNNSSLNKEISFVGSEL